MPFALPFALPAAVQPYLWLIKIGFVVAVGIGGGVTGWKLAANSYTTDIEKLKATHAEENRTRAQLALKATQDALDAVKWADSVTKELQNAKLKEDEARSRIDAERDAELARLRGDTASLLARRCRVPVPVRPANGVPPATGASGVRPGGGAGEGSDFIEVLGKMAGLFEATERRATENRTRALKLQEWIEIQRKAINKKPDGLQPISTP